MIRSLRHKGLAELFRDGRSAKIDAKMHRRIRLRLDSLNDATTLDDLKMPGYDFHSLRGFEPIRYTIHVNGPWCITFEFDGRDVWRVDFEQYH